MPTVRQSNSHTAARRSTASRRLLMAAAVVIVAAGWYLFRPERAFISHRVHETFPATATQQSAALLTAPVPLSQGHFHSVAHATQGLAAIYQLPDGKRVLRLTAFETSNGPDVRVYLVAANDATDNETVTKAGFISLGALKGNIGDQNYEVPADTDLAAYQAVTIWCRRFGVNFGTAPLTRQPG